MTSLSKRWAVALLLCAAVSGASPAAQAGQDEDGQAARALFEQAEARFRAKDYAAALALYERAYQRKPLPGFHFNIGQCHRHLGSYDEATKHFRAYLESSDKPRHRQSAEKLLALCEREKQKQDARQLPTAAGAEQATAASPATAAATPTENAPSAPGKRFKPIHFWAAAGISAALLLTGAISAIMALQKSLEFNDPDTAYNRLSALQSSGVTLRTTSIITLALGALGAAGSTWIFFHTDFHGGSATVTAAPIGDGAGLVATGWF